MIKLDDNLLAELGLQALPQADKKELLRQIYETLEMRVGTTLAQQMTDAQLDEFEGFISANNEAGALQWLETNFPNYKDVVAQEFEKLKEEVRHSVPQILASVQQAQSQHYAQQQYAPQQPYPAYPHGPQQAQAYATPQHAQYATPAPMPPHHQGQYAQSQHPQQAYTQQHQAQPYQPQTHPQYDGRAPGQQFQHQPPQQQAPYDPYGPSQQQDEDELLAA